MAYALVAADLAECYSFVQVCDQDEMRLAYLTIVILLCLLFFACAYICKLCCARNASDSQVFSNSPVRTLARTYCVCRYKGEYGGAS